jgi:hypothetical protein
MTQARTIPSACFINICFPCCWNDFPVSKLKLLTFQLKSVTMMVLALAPQVTYDVSLEK